MKTLARIAFFALVVYVGLELRNRLSGLEVVNQTRRELDVAVLHFQPHVARPAGAAQARKDSWLPEDKSGKWICEGWTRVGPGQNVTVYRGDREKVFVHLHFVGSIDCYAPGQFFKQAGSYVNPKPFVLERSAGSPRQWATVQVEGKELGTFRPTDLRQHGFYWEARFYEIWANTRLTVAY
jgi:hypothetical protein